jgi:hypothetical protein
MEAGQNIFSSRSVSIKDIPSHDFSYKQQLSVSAELAEAIDQKVEHMEMSNFRNSAEL